jgi:hypothetical protein
MAYMGRLGLWGVGTSWAGTAEEDGTGTRGFADFLSTLESRGMAAMELVATDLKRMGAYVCRTLSYEGASFKLEEEILDEHWTGVYDSAARFWMELRQALSDAMEKYPDGMPDKHLGRERSAEAEWADNWKDSDDEEQEAEDERRKRIAPKSLWRYR